MTALRYAFLLALPLIPASQLRIDEGLGPYRAQEEVLYLSSGDDVKRCLPGLEDVAADIYWLRTVQYYGGQRAFSATKRFELLHPLIDITTTLDPRFELAYRYGAIFLSEAWPVGAGQPRQGIEILENGIRRNPQWWRLRWDLASLHFFFLKDARKAAELLVEASKLKGAPYWLESLAGSILIESDREVAREIWKRQYEQGEGAMRENALYHLRVLDALDARDALDDMIGKFNSSHGRLPASWDEMVKARLLRAVPTDPTGVAFAYDPAAGKANISRSSKLWRSKYEN